MPDIGLLLSMQDTLWCLDRDGELCVYDGKIHGPQSWIALHPELLVRQFKVARESLIDLAELWTFARPLQAPPRTLFHLLSALEQPLLSRDSSAEEALAAFRRAIHLLLETITKTADARERVRGLIAYLANAQWVFASALHARLGIDLVECQAIGSDDALVSIIQAIEKWPDDMPRGRGDLGISISEDEAVEAFQKRLPKDAETRPQQQEYARAVQQVFSPMSNIARGDESARVTLLQAGTGIGKTMGYLASARLWAERNDEPVWITTYSRHLQDQIAGEVQRQGMGSEMVIRKGRENYLCLLNYDDLVRAQLGLVPEQRVLLGILARWLMATPSGILVGGDFPLWLEERLDGRVYNGLRLKQGECLYRACTHYARCFLESTVRQTQQAKLVIANHALTLLLAAKQQLPSSRIIVDEAHQLFDATDSATQVRLGLFEVRELQRWLFGGTRNNRHRQRRGLAQRCNDLRLSEDGHEALRAVQTAGEIFADPEGREARIIASEGVGALENFFAAVAGQFPKEKLTQSFGYGDELPLGERKDEHLLENTALLQTGFQRLQKSLKQLVLRLEEMETAAEETEDMAAQNQLSSLKNIIEEYPLVQLDAWLYLLARLQENNDAAAQTRSVVERMYLRPKSQRYGFDTGVEMAFLDPCEILQDWLYSPPQKALLLTSASLEVGDDQGRDFAYRRTGLTHLSTPEQTENTQISTQQFLSPFDYATHARAYIATDVDHQNAKAVNMAMQTLFLASGGGALGLFTAIRRAQIGYGAMHDALDAAGIPLYSQHDDQAGNMFLAECMRQQRNASLLATDAFRDGVDIPGAALRLVVMERIPWSQPNLIHRHRRQHFGKNYNTQITRQRLQQAFGRLIRTAQDWGSFVIFGNAMPSALKDAFPVPIQAMPLAQIAQEIRAQNGR